MCETCGCDLGLGMSARYGVAEERRARAVTKSVGDGSTLRRFDLRPASGSFEAAFFGILRGEDCSWAHLERVVLPHAIGLPFAGPADPRLLLFAITDDVPCLAQEVEAVLVAEYHQQVNKRVSDAIIMNYLSSLDEGMETLQDWLIKQAYPQIAENTSIRSGLSVLCCEKVAEAMIDSREGLVQSELRQDAAICIASSFQRSDYTLKGDLARNLALDELDYYYPIPAS